MEREGTRETNIDDSHIKENETRHIRMQNDNIK